MSRRPPPPIFTRLARPSPCNPLQLAGPMEDRTLRDWERTVFTAVLGGKPGSLLRERLQRPASRTCRRVYASLDHWQPVVQGAFSSESSPEHLRECLRKAQATRWSPAGYACAGWHWHGARVPVGGVWCLSARGVTQAVEEAGGAPGAA